MRTMSVFIVLPRNECCAIAVLAGETPMTQDLTGQESYTITLPTELSPGMLANVTVCEWVGLVRVNIPALIMKCSGRLNVCELSKACSVLA